MNNIRIVLLFLILSALVIFSQGCRLIQENSTDEAFTSSVKSKVYSVSFEPSELTHLQTIIISGIDATEATASISPTNQMKLSVKALSDTEQGLNDFFEHVQAEDDGVTLKIKLFSNMSHMCHYQQVGGFINVKGICAKDLKIELPQTSPIRVILNDIRGNKYVVKIQNGRIVQELYAGDTLEELLNILRQTGFSSDQLKVLELHLKYHSGRIFSVRDAEQVINSIFFSERFKVARLLSGRIIDRENLDHLEKFFPFTAEWQEIREYLSQ